MSETSKPLFRCMDLTKAPGGWLQCMRPLGHPDHQLHWVDPADKKITEQNLIKAQEYLGETFIIVS